MTLTLWVFTCGLAVAAAVLSLVALARAEHAGRCARPFVLPIFVAAAYVILQGMSIYDAANGTPPRAAVVLAGDLITAMLFVSLILVLAMNSRQRR